MCDEWMPHLQFSLTPEQFQQLPRNSAYKYEYVNALAQLSPRPKHFHALLDLRPLPAEPSVCIQPCSANELIHLEPVFAEAFREVQPYGSLDEVTRRAAAHQALERTRTGGDGPWIERASFVARSDEHLVGAILITLLPPGDPCDGDTYYWAEPPPADCIARCQGHPHLTWIFVAPPENGYGTGTALLAAAVQALLAMGFTQLLSTFIAGNDRSMLWHWRNGFQLLAHPGSRRLMRQRWQSDWQQA